MASTPPSLASLPRLSPLAAAKQKAGESWFALTAVQRLEALDTVREEESLSLGEASPSAAVLPARDRSPAARARVGDSVRDLADLLGRLDAHGVVGIDGHDLSSLQHTVASTLTTVEQNLAEMHEQTERYATTSEAEKVALKRERDDAVALGEAMKSRCAELEAAAVAKERFEGVRAHHIVDTGPGGAFRVKAVKKADGENAARKRQQVLYSPARVAPLLRCRVGRRRQGEH